MNPWPLVNVGDRVRVVLEGLVRDLDGDGDFAVGEDRDGNFVAPHAAHVVSVEVLARPEKEWVDGDVVRDAISNVYVRDLDRWWVAGGRGLVPHIYPKRPLTELVPKETT